MRLALLALSIATLLVADARAQRSPAESEILTAVKRRDAKALAGLLATPLTYDGGWFPDAACAKRFAGGVLQTRDKVAFAQCLAKLVPQLSTRAAAHDQGVLLTIEPGLELEVVLSADDGRVRWLGPAGAADDKGTPMLTAQAFEALRTGGTTLLDDKVRDLDAELARANPTSAWIRTCLDARGAATRSVAWAATPATGEAFLRATSDWTFRPFVYRKLARPACALSLLTYPAGKAPSTERLPKTAAPGRVSYSFEDDLDFARIDIVGPPSIATLQPYELSALALAPLVPAPASPSLLANTPRDRISSINVCIDTKGAVRNVVTLDQQPGDRVRAAKMWRWRFKPYVQAGVPTEACALLQFLVMP